MPALASRAADALPAALLAVRDAPPAYLPRRHVYRIDGEHVAVRLHEPGPDARAVPEALVHALWAQQRFARTGLATTDGQPLVVLDPGTLNRDGGPDFRHAHVRFGGLDWRGDVEIHTTSGAWFDHGHHHDPHYDSVVLHVTLAADMWTGGLLRADGTTLPELVLLPRLDEPLRALLHAFYTRDADALPCAARFAEVPAPTRRAWIRRLGRDRLRAKAEALDARAAPADRLHRALFAALGYAPNAEPMADLARRLPRALTRTLPDVPDLEALHLGVAGLLPAPGDLLDADRATADHVMELRARFARLNARFEVPLMNGTSWQFFRLRPANFPTLRIAQAVALLAPGGLLCDADPVARLAAAAQTEPDPVAALVEALHAQPSAFWATHYRPAKATKPRDPGLGKGRRRRLLVDAALPVLLRHAAETDDDALADAVLAVFDRLPAGRDRVVRRFRALGTAPASALETQGLHQLYRAYCTEGGCLTCAIGTHLLGRASDATRSGGPAR